LSASVTTVVQRKRFFRTSSTKRTPVLHAARALISPPALMRRGEGMILPVDSSIALSAKIASCLGTLECYCLWNPKLQAPNYKQISNSNIQWPKHFWNSSILRWCKGLGFRNWGPARRVGSPKNQFWSLWFVYYLKFVIWNFWSLQQTAARAERLFWPLRGQFNIGSFGPVFLSHSFIQNQKPGSWGQSSSHRA
jgi:hypothetical protein